MTVDIVISVECVVEGKMKCYFKNDFWAHGVRGKETKLQG